MKETIAYCDLCAEHTSYGSHVRDKVRAYSVCFICGRDVCNHHVSTILDRSICTDCQEKPEVQEVSESVDRLKDLLAKEKLKGKPS